MSFHDTLASEDQAPLAEINMVPLIDVMMVLLVIFLVTAPLLTNAVKVALPQASSHAEAAHGTPIEIAIDSTGALVWNTTSITRSALQQRLQDAAQQTPVPELRLRADRKTPYETVAPVMADASRMGIVQIGFVTLPDQP